MKIAIYPSTRTSDRARERSWKNMFKKRTNVRKILAWFCCLRTSRELISLAFRISMLLSILICLYFLFLPSSRNEFCSRGGRSSNFISGLLSWCSKLRPQFCLLRLRLNVDMIIAMTIVTMWMYFMANCQGKGCGWGLATTGVSALLHFIYGLIMGKFLEWVFTKSINLCRNFWQKLNIINCFAIGFGW